jgi:hypothetical protein
MASRSDIAGANILDMLVGARNKFSVGLLADAAQSLTLSHQPVLYGVPTAARVITMPAVTSANDGAFFIIINKSAGANALTINNAAAAGIGDLLQNEAGIVICVGGAWTTILVGTST